MVHIHNGILKVCKEKNEIIKSGGKWAEVENTILSKVTVIFVCLLGTRVNLAQARVV